MENVFWGRRDVFFTFSDSGAASQHNFAGGGAARVTQGCALVAAPDPPSLDALCVVSRSGQVLRVVKHPHLLGWWVGWASGFSKGLVTQGG